MSKRKYDALSRADQELIRAKATESVPVMRALWDEKQAAAKQIVLDAGVHYNVAEIDQFRRAVEPMRARFARDETAAAMLKRIEAHE